MLHTLQSIEPSVAECFPAWQSRQNVAPLLFWYFPVGHAAQEFRVMEDAAKRPGEQARQVSVKGSVTWPGGHPHSLFSMSQYNPLLAMQSTNGPQEQVPLLGVVPLVWVQVGDRLQALELDVHTRPEPGVHSFLPHLHTFSLGFNPNVFVHSGEYAH